MPSTGWFKASFIESLSTPTTGASGTIRLNNTNTVKCALFTNSLGSQDFDTDEGYADTPYTSNECPATGNYSTGGVALSAPTISVAPAGTIKFTAGYATWNSATIAAYCCLVYDDTAGDKGIVAVDFGGLVEATGGTFEVRWNTNGILTFT